MPSDTQVTRSVVQSAAIQRKAVPTPMSDLLIARAATPNRAAITGICIAEILSLASYATVPALLPQLMQTWSLDAGQAGWLASMLFAGYMLGVLPLVSLTDAIAARHIYLACSALSAISCLALAVVGDWRLALLWRGIGGVTLAGMYMPGLRAVTDGLTGLARARVAAAYTSAFTLGTSLSFLTGQIGIVLDWRSAFVLAGVLGILGTALAFRCLPRIPPPRARRRYLPDLRPVLRNRASMTLVASYAATIWGCAGIRQWIVLFLLYCAGSATGVAQGWTMLLAGTVINALGVPAGLLGNELSLRFGLRRAAIVTFLLSTFVCITFSFVASLPYGLALAAALLAGFVLQGNFANLTTALLMVADPVTRGATMALYSCVGFGGGFLGTLLFGLTLYLAGGPNRGNAWTLAFATCGMACLAGALVLRALPPSLGRAGD